MARWKLIEPHYLRVDGVKWEYNEVDRITGRPKRTQFPVPQYMNPNYEEDVKVYGQPLENGDTGIIVSDGVDARPRDVIFVERDGSPGKPTPGMLPLDAAAIALSAKYEKVWTPPTEAQPSFVTALEEKFIAQMAEIQAGLKTAPAAEGLGDFMQGMTAMMKQQTEILAALAKSVSIPQRRAV